MRRHRHALMIAIPVALVATVFTVFASSGATPKEEATAWTSSPASQTIHSSPRTDLLTTQSLMPLAVFATAVESAQAQEAAQAAQAAANALALREAASSQTQAASGPSAPATTSTTPDGCAPSYQAMQDARAAAAGVPCAWIPTAICEEQGYDDANYGYFGIQSWNGFDGYPNAGAAPLDVQLGWEAAHGQGPPDAPGQCHGY